MSHSVDVDDDLEVPHIHPETEENANRFRGKRWREIDDSILLDSCPSPFLLSPIAFCYFLPAFMLAALRHPESNLTDSLVNFALLPPKKPEKISTFQERFASLTSAQKEAVTSLLLFSVPTEQDEMQVRKARRINDAIDRFWGVREQDTGCRDG